MSQQCPVNIILSIITTLAHEKLCRSVLSQLCLSTKAMGAAHGPFQFQVTHYCVRKQA